MYSYAWTKDMIMYGLNPESDSVSISTSSPNNSASWYAVTELRDKEQLGPCSSHMDRLLNSW